MALHRLLFGTVDIFTVFNLVRYLLLVLFPLTVLACEKPKDDAKPQGDPAAQPAATSTANANTNAANPNGDTNANTNAIANANAAVNTNSAPARTGTDTIPESDLVTSADFEDEAEKAITSKNYKSELTALETEVTTE